MSIVILVLGSLIYWNKNSWLNITEVSSAYLCVVQSAGSAERWLYFERAFCLVLCTVRVVVYTDQIYKYSVKYVHQYSSCRNVVFISHIPFLSSKYNYYPTATVDVIQLTSYLCCTYVDSFSQSHVALYSVNLLLYPVMWTTKINRLHTANAIFLIIFYVHTLTMQDAACIRHVCTSWYLHIRWLLRYLVDMIKSNHRQLAISVLQLT